MYDRLRFPIDPAYVDAIDHLLVAASNSRGYRFVDLRPAMGDDARKLETEFSNDWIRLLGTAYASWRDAACA